MVKKYVYGVYPTVVEAEDAVTNVINQGVPRESVALVGTRAHAYDGEAEFISYGELLEEQHEDNRGFFAKLFGWNDNDNDEEFENVDFTEYEDSLNRDELLLLVDQDFESQLTAFDARETDELRTDNDMVIDDSVGTPPTDTLNAETPAFSGDELRTDNGMVTDDSIGTPPIDTLNAETAAFSGAVGSTGGLTEDDPEFVSDNTVGSDYTSDVVDSNDTYVDVNADTNKGYDDVNVEDNDYDPHIIGDETHIEAEGEPVGLTDTDTERIRLHEEQVHAQTRKKDLGDVSITKEVVEDTKTVEVPVEREEVHIRHTDTKEHTTGNDDAFVEEEIIIPVSEDEVVVDKDTVITDEIEVEKTTHTDSETVTETTRREELDIDDETGRLREDNDTLR